VACHIYDSPNHILDIPLSRPKQKSLSSLPLRGPGTLDGSIGDGKPGAIRSEIEIIWNVNVPLESVIWGSMGSGSRREMGWRDMGDEAEAYRFRIEFREITRARAPLRARFSAGAGQRLSISIPMMADNLDNLGTLSYGARTGTGPRSNELKQRL
jgi:hypothetical protein